MKRRASTAAPLAAIAIIAILIVHAAFARKLASTVPESAPATTAQITPAPSSTRQITSDDSAVDRGRFDLEQDGGQGTPDLYGNEVTDAVARYKLDAGGSLYELHSPQTELPRPRPPKAKTCRMTEGAG